MSAQLLFSYYTHIIENPFNDNYFVICTYLYMMNNDSIKYDHNVMNFQWHVYNLFHFYENFILFYFMIRTLAIRINNTYAYSHMDSSYQK